MFGLVPGKPRELGGGQGCHGDGAGQGRPVCRARGRVPCTGVGDQPLRVGSRARVIPEQRGAHDVPCLIQAHHSVLLSADGNGIDVVQASGLGDGFLQRCPPVVRVHLGAFRVGSAALADQDSGG